MGMFTRFRFRNGSTRRTNASVHVFSPGGGERSVPPGTAKVSANPGEVKHEDDQQSQDGTRVLDGFLDEGGPELKAQLTLDPQGSDDFLMAEIEAGEDQNGNLTGILRGFTESGLTHMAIMT